MALDATKIAALNQASGFNVPTTPGTMSPQQSRAAQVRALAQTAMTKRDNPLPFDTSNPTPESAQAVAGATLRKDANDITGMAKSGIQHGAEGIDEILHPKGTTLGEGIVQGGEGAMKVLSGVATTALSPAAPLFNKMGEGASKLTDKISDIPAVQKAGMAALNFDFNRAASFAGDVGNTAGAIAGAEAPAKVGEMAAKVPELPEIPKAELHPIDALRGYADTKVKAGIEKEVSGLLKGTKAISRRTQEAAKQGTDFQQILSDPQIFKGINVENGKINPDHAIETIDSRIDPLMEAKRTILPEVDKLVPAVSKDVITNAAIEDVKGKYTPADEKALIGRIEGQMSAVKDYLKPSEIDNLRAQMRQSSREARGQQKSESEYAALENAARNKGFEITDNLPIKNAGEYKALNDYVKQMIKTKEFLHDTLRSQVVKGGRVGVHMGRLIGAAVGGPHGAVPGIISAYSGGVIADLIANNALGSSFKMKLIRNITQDPAILAQAEKLVTDIQSAGNAQTKNLFTPQTETAVSNINQTIPDSVPPKPEDVKGAGLPPKEQGGGPTKRNNQRGMVNPGQAAADIKDAFKGFTDLTTKLLKDIEGKTEISKQYLLDATNRAELKQPERDLFRFLLKDEPNKISAKEFANKVKAELLPLKRRDVGNPHESTTLDESLRGPIANYAEHVYESPIKTSAGNQHFSPRGGITADEQALNRANNKIENYFAHTRIEDLPGDAGGKVKGIEIPEGQTLAKGKGAQLYDKGGTRRVIELQSDLFQKGRLEREAPAKTYETVTPSVREAPKYLGEKDGAELQRLQKKEKLTDKEGARYDELSSKLNTAFADAEKAAVAPREAELAKLEPYRNTWQERIIREEVKQAAKDGKTKLQFPTGETAMKIEGLGIPEGDRFQIVGESVDDVGRNNQGLARNGGNLTADKLKVGTVYTTDSTVYGRNNYLNNDTQHQWIITDVLGDGKFKAISKHQMDELLRELNADPLSNKMTAQDALHYLDRHANEDFNRYTETFDISGKVDKENPIYKFYEKEVGRYLDKKYGAKKVTDPQGVTWYEVPVKKEMAVSPIEAFGVGLGITAGAKSQEQN